MKLEFKWVQGYNKIILFIFLGIVFLSLALFGIIAIFTRFYSNTNKVETKPQTIQTYDKEFGDITWKDKDVVFYEGYSELNVERLGLDKTNIYFFVQNNCTLCQDLEKEILSSIKETKSNTSIFKIDIEKNSILVNAYKSITPGTLIVVKYSDKTEVKRIQPSSDLYPKNLKEIITFSK